MDYDGVLEFGCNLARKAGKMIAKAFKEHKVVSEKDGVADLVTETDQNVEKMVIEEIFKQYPTHKFIGEESVAAGKPCILTDEPTWVVDPIDGTTNFVHRFPQVAICLGFCVKQERVIGIVYNPVLDEMYSALKGKGAFLNGNKIQVSSQKDVRKSVVMTETGAARDEERVDAMFANFRSVLLTPVHGTRSLGTAACNIMAVAAGSAEVYYEYGMHCWDYCAASLILEEAGGVAIDTTGGEMDLMARRVICANCPEIAQAISKRLTTIEMPRD